MPCGGNNLDSIKYRHSKVKSSTHLNLLHLKITNHIGKEMENQYLHYIK
jgi:hypothetical protein